MRVRDSLSGCFVDDRPPAAHDDIADEVDDPAIGSESLRSVHVDLDFGRVRLVMPDPDYQAFPSAALSVLGCWNPEDKLPFGQVPLGDAVALQEKAAAGTDFVVATRHFVRVVPGV